MNGFTLHSHSSLFKLIGFILSSRLGTPALLQAEVCFLCFRLVSRRCHNISAIPTVVPQSLTEPDKRISQTSGSSVNHSDRRYSTTWIQVFADNRSWPSDVVQGLSEAFPCVASSLTLAVDPLKKNPRGMVDVTVTSFPVIRYCVIAQMARHSYPGLPQHLALAQTAPALARPVGKLIQA
jgi:hypothetical protein